MIIDILFLGLLALFGYFGYRSGTLRQLAQWAGMVFGRLLAKPVALVLTLALAPELGIPPMGARVGISALCFYTFAVIGTIIAYFFIKRLARKHHHGKLDRVGGLLLGATKGAALLYVLVSVAVFFEGPRLGGGLVIGLVRSHNPFTLPPPRLAQVRKLQTLLGDPKMQASFQDAALVDAIKAGNWDDLQKDPRVATLLADPRVAASLADPLDDE